MEFDKSFATIFDETIATILGQTFFVFGVVDVVILLDLTAENCRCKVTLEGAEITRRAKGDGVDISGSTSFLFLLASRGPRSPRTEVKRKHPPQEITL